MAQDRTTEPANLRFLRRLVTVLTAVMICGVTVIVALLILRLQAPPRLALPDTIGLPDGARAVAFTQGRDWYAVVTEADEILVFDRDTGALAQRLRIGGDMPATE